MVQKAYKFRLYPNKEQREYFARTFGCVRFVYNRMLAEKIACYEETGKSLSVTPAKYKSEFPMAERSGFISTCQCTDEFTECISQFFS